MLATHEASPRPEKAATAAAVSERVRGGRTSAPPIANIEVAAMPLTFLAASAKKLSVLSVASAKASAGPELHADALTVVANAATRTMLPFRVS